MQLVSSWYRMQTLPAMAKAGIVAGGYVAALLLAFGVVSIYIGRTSGPDRALSSGMSAFGDSLLFVAVLGVVSTIPTGLALVFLRQSRSFWIVLSFVALVVASTSLAAVAAVAWEPQNLAPGENLKVWALLAVFRILVSPFLAAVFGLSALAAPGARFRWYLSGAASVEGASTVYGVFRWFSPLFFH